MSRFGGCFVVVIGILVVAIGSSTNSAVGAGRLLLRPQTQSHPPQSDDQTPSVLENGPDSNRQDSDDTPPSDASKIEGDEAKANLADPVEKELAEIMGRYEQRRKPIVDEIQKAPPTDQMRLWKEKDPLPDFAPELFAFVKKYPDSPAALRAISLLISQGTGDVRRDAVRVMIDRYRDEKEIIPIIDAVTIGVPSPEIEQWLDELSEKSRNRDVQAKAMLTRINYIRSINDILEYSRTNPEFAGQIDAASLDYLKAYDLQQAEVRKIELLTRLSKDFADLPSNVTSQTYGELAELELFAINKLAVGKVAPEIEGTDLDGKKFKLSDYRGKIVMLFFWGDWCAPVRAMYPQLRSLMSKLQDEPFALIGVNSDINRGRIRGTTDNLQLGWRNFWDRNSHGPISRAWQVNSWPSVFVLDREGVIRYKQVFGAELDLALMALLKEIGHEVDLQDHSGGKLPEPTPLKENDKSADDSKPLSTAGDKSK
jgi:thiol-disulfide isomerase/thioredoxin